MESFGADRAPTPSYACKVAVASVKRKERLVGAISILGRKHGREEFRPEISFQRRQR